MFFKSISHATAFIALTIHSVVAEPDSEKARHVRILALGDSPPFRQEIRNGVRYELEPPPESIPPREVIFGSGKDLSDAVELRLGRISVPVEVPAGEGFLDLRVKGEAPDAAPWVSVKRPESGDFLVFLWRNPSKPNWRGVDSLNVPDGPLGAPVDTVRIVNLFPLPIRIVWGPESLVLPGGKTMLRPIKPGAEVPFQILVADAGGAMQSYYSGAVTQNHQERGLVVIYRADGESPRRPLKVVMMREPVPPEPPKPGPKKNS
jgi:hypothetical protein